MDYTGIKKQLESVIAITVTPFGSDGGVDTVACSTLVQHMTKMGIGVLTPNGNTSEFYSLGGLDEWLAAMDANVQGADGALVMPGVGFDVDMATRMAVHAQTRGAGAVMVHQPVHPFMSREGWIRYHQLIAAAVPDMGIVPYVRSPRVESSWLSELTEVSPNVVGVKYAVPDPLKFGAMVQSVGREQVAWVCGLAEPWAPFFWLAGARGFTSGLANVDPRVSLDMLRHLREGDDGATMRLWYRIRPFEELRARRGDENNVSVVKEALAQLGHCNRSVRPPISELVSGEREEVRQLLDEWGLL